MHVPADPARPHARPALAAPLPARALVPLTRWLARATPALPAPRPGARRALLAAAAALALCLGWALAPRAAAEREPDDAERLRRALAEARINCLVADLAAEGRAQDPLFQTEELLAALRTELVQRGAYGELPALEREARWVGGLTTTSDLGPRTWEDVRFLVGALHWYLTGAAAEAAPGEEHVLAHEAYRQEALAEFRGLGFYDLLDAWD